MNRPFSRATIVKNTALTLAVFIVIAMTLRVVVAGELAVAATGIAAMCAAGLFGVTVRVQDDASADIGGFAVLGIAFFVYASLSWMSDGLGGSVVYAGVMLPLIAGLMLGKRVARNVTILTGAFLLLVLSQHLTGGLVPDPDFPQETRFSMRVAVLLLMLVSMNWLLAYYDLMARSQAAHPEGEDALHDPLTGLLQPGAFQQALTEGIAKAAAEGAHCSLALVAVDNFQRLQTDFGTQASERCLLGVADALRYCLRRGNDDLGRFDENLLCILMIDGGNGMGHLVERFRKVMETLDIAITETDMQRVTVSVGFCTAAATSALAPNNMIDSARDALQRAREDGGNRCLSNTL